VTTRDIDIMFDFGRPTRWAPMADRNGSGQLSTTSGSDSVTAPDKSPTSRLRMSMSNAIISLHVFKKPGSSKADMLRGAFINNFRVATAAAIPGAPTEIFMVA